MTTINSTPDSNSEMFVHNRINTLIFLKKIGLIFLVFMLLTFWLNTTASAQEIKNIRVTQEGSRVNVVYDLEGKGQIFNVSLYYTTNDGLSWEGPLKGATGDVGDNIQPGSNKQISLNLQTENNLKEGYLKFKVTANVFEATIPVESNSVDSQTKPQKIKYKTGKNVSLTLALVSAGTGLIAYIQGNKLYDEYQTATDDAADIHKKIETYDIIAPVAFAIAGISTVSFIIYSSKYGKAKKQIAFQPVPLKNGGGLMLTYKF